MFRQPKALKEINKIQEIIYKEEKNISSKERVARIRLEADAVRKEFGLRNKQAV